MRALVASDRDERMAGLRASLPYIYAAAGCAVATLVNPYFYHLHEHILKYLNDPFQTTYIQEIQSMNFRSGAAIYFEVMLVLGLGAAVWYGKRKQFTEVLLIVGWAHLSLIVVRNVPIFMIAAAPIVGLPMLEWLKALSRAPIAGWLRRIFGSIEPVGLEIEPLERPWRLHAMSVAVLLVLGAGHPVRRRSPVFRGYGEVHAGVQSARAIHRARWRCCEQPGSYAYFHARRMGRLSLLYHAAWPKGVKVYVDGAERLLRSGIRPEVH